MPGSILALFFFAALAVLLFKPLMILLLGIAMRGTSTTLSPPEITRDVASLLTGARVFSGMPHSDPDFTNFQNGLARRMQGIHGYTQSDGFHGDGTDWYEVELTRELADELRAAIAKSASSPVTDMTAGLGSRPSWWPTTWPADALCYDQHLQYIIVTPTGTRAWLLRIRT